MNNHLGTLPPTQRWSPRSLFSIWVYGRLLRHTFFIAILLVNGGLITSGAIELFFRYQESEKGMSALQQGMADAAAFKIQQYVETITHTLQTAGQTSEIISDGITDDYRFQLSKLIRVFPAITTITAVDIIGREKLKESRVQIVDGDNLSDRSMDKAFIRAKTGVSFFGPIYFIRQSEPYMQIAVPIELFAGEIIGVLIAEVNLKYIWDVISSIHAGETGYAYVVSSEGDLIAHPDISLALQMQNLKHLSQVEGALNGIPLKVKHQSLQGETVFATYALIPTLGWVVFVERLTGEAYAPLYASILRLGLFLFIGLGMGGLASWLINRRVMRPIEALREGAERFGAGTLYYRINLHTGDELQLLAETFNRMAEQLQASYAHLEEKVESRTRELESERKKLEIESRHKSEFLAHMSHELRTPLNAIISFVEMTLENQFGDIPEKVRERLGRVASSSNHLLNLIDRIFDISSIEAGKVELTIGQYSMLGLIDNVVVTLENKALGKQLQLAATTPPDLPIGLGDEAGLMEVLLNLVDNAIKYTDVGEIRIEVAVSEDNFNITVSDTGPGISLADQQRIFESFEQAHASETRVRSGMGVGLSICKSMVELHGGSIGVESNLGKGSSFWCTFPIRVERQKE